MQRNARGVSWSLLNQCRTSQSFQGDLNQPLMVVLQDLGTDTTAWDPSPTAHRLAKLPLTSMGVWPDGALQAMIWLDEQLCSITIIYDVLLAAPNVHRFDIHLLG